MCTQVAGRDYAWSRNCQACAVLGLVCGSTHVMSHLCVQVAGRVYAWSSNCQVCLVLGVVCGSTDVMSHLCVQVAGRDYTWSSNCQACGQGGNLALCDQCPCALHPGCLGMTLKVCPHPVWVHAVWSKLGGLGWTDWTVDIDAA